VLHKVPIVTTITGANAAARAIQALQREDWGVQPLQSYFGEAAAKAQSKARPAATGRA
jgi:hypothetical protein